MSSCVLRVRPAAQTFVGLALDQAQAVMQELRPGAAASAFPLEFLLEVPLGVAEFSDMAQALVDGATYQDIIFVEANFSTKDVPRSYQVLDSLISCLLTQDAVLESPCRVLISMQELPNEVDQIYELLGVPQLDGRISIVNDLGECLGDPAPARQLVECLEHHPAPADSVERSLLRHRGVFRSTNSGRVSNYLFYYEALPRAIARFQKALHDVLNQVRPDLVVFDTSTSGPWFASMVQAACVQLQTELSATLTPVDIAHWVAYQHDQLREPELPRVEAAAEVLSAPDSSVVVVVPAYASGRSLTRAMELLGSPDTDRCTAVAVFADTDAELVQSGLPGMQGMARQAYGRLNLDVHCMQQVELRTIDRHDWLVSAAEALGEIRELPVGEMDHGVLDTVALWSLYGDCGVGIERLPPGGRSAKRYFPDLAKLTDWDAHWLAEAAVVNILDRLPQSNRGALLIVIPAEATGTRPISQALLEKCRTAVLAVPRAMIEGDEVVTKEIHDKLKKHTADTIAVLDESTVTHGTLERLARLVNSSIRIDPDLLGAIVDASTAPPKLEIPFFSLTGWAALAEQVAK